MVLEGVEFLQAHRYLIQRNRGILKDFQEAGLLFAVFIGRAAFVSIYERLAGNEVFLNHS